MNLNSGCRQRTRVMSWSTPAPSKSVNCRNMWREQTYRISMYAEQQAKRCFSEDPFWWCSRILRPWARSMTLGNDHSHLKKNGLKAKLDDSKGLSTASTRRFFWGFCLFGWVFFYYYCFILFPCFVCFSVFLLNLFWFVEEVAREKGRSQETGIQPGSEYMMCNPQRINQK